MVDYVIFGLWFFAPAGVANAAPIFANKIPYLNKWRTPLDFGQSYKGKRILGDNKTWRGFCTGVMAAVLTLVLQKYLFNDSAWLQSNITTLDYSTVSLWLGFLLGSGALLGDAIESLFKRRAGVPSGEAWFPFDQLDYIIGGILLSSIIVTLSPIQNIVILLLWFGLHLLSSYIGFLVGLKPKPL